MKHAMRPNITTERRERRAKTPEQALSTLMRLCARAEKSTGDARRLMRNWGVADADAEKVLDRLLSDRFIDDTRYAEAFVREKLRLSGWGEYKIRAALQRKGVARETIEEALGAADRTGTAERLHTQLERKLRLLHCETRYELKNKLMRYGLGLGYDYETVHETVAALVADTESCDDF